MNTSKHCIIRLSKYRNALLRFKTLGFVKVFSDNLADAVGVTSSQVRKDFSIFGIAGNKKGGYMVESLITSLNNILGKNTLQKAIIIGMGNIGTALLNYRGFEKEEIKIIAGFDIDPNKFNKAGTPPILPIDELRDFIRKNGIKIGILCVPDLAGQQVLEQLVSAGIKGVLNFAPIRLRAPEDVVITNVNLVAELENIIYFVNIFNK